MNWGKFKRKGATSPIVTEAVEDIASPLSGNLERDLKSFVTQVLEYVAFRPFSNLVLTLSQELEVSGPVRGFYDHQRMWQATTYAVYFRVGEETSFRSRNIGDTDTVEECLAQLEEWYQGVASQIGSLWEVYVVKYVGSGGVYGRTRATLEIFQVPEPTFLVQRTPNTFLLQEDTHV